MDVPERVVWMWKKRDEEGVFNCKVRWAKRRDGSRPLLSTVTNEELKLAHPRVLIEFYESNIVLKGDGDPDQNSAF